MKNNKNTFNLMKNIYRKLLPLFGASCCIIPNKYKELSNIVEKSEIINVEAKLDKLSKNQKVLISNENKQVKEFINELNKTEIYLLVTDPIKEKFDKHILLLLHTEDRLNAEQAVTNWRHIRFLFSFNNVNYSQWNINRNIPFKWAARPNKFPLISKAYRNGKSYYVNNLGGYKSICPVFFDKASAEDFLVQTSKDALTLLQKIPVKSKGVIKKGSKEFLKGLSNTKIISVGLGDFIEYYSLDETKTYLDKIEFLFVPCIQKEIDTPKSLEKSINRIVKNKNFKLYQKEYFDLKLSNNK